MKKLVFIALFQTWSPALADSPQAHPWIGHAFIEGVPAPVAEIGMETLSDCRKIITGYMRMRNDVFDVGRDYGSCIGEGVIYTIDPEMESSLPPTTR